MTDTWLGLPDETGYFAFADGSIIVWGGDALTTLWDATLELARTLSQATEGTATGGNATTVVDTLRSEPNAYFNGGTIWLCSGNNIGKSTTITTWDLPTVTFTHPTLTLLNAVGDRYAVASKEYPRWELIQAVNDAIASMGHLPVTDITLTTVAHQEAYDLAAATRDIKRVEIATNLTSPYDYQIQYHWREYEGQLVFDTGFEPDSSSYPMRITYMGAHAALTADNNAISQYINMNSLKWRAAIHALRWKVSRTKGDEPWTLKLLNEALQNAEREEAKWPVLKQYKDPHGAGY